MNFANGREGDGVAIGKSGKSAAFAFGAMRLPRFLTMLALVAAAAASAMAANPSLTFTGGLGTPLVITLETPVSYIATVSSGSAPAFIFKNVGLIYNGIFDVTGDITFSINGGPATAITGTQWDFSNNDVTANDFIMFGAFGTVTAGDTVTLSAGTITTGTSLPGPTVPSSGTYETFIASEPGNNIGSGTAVPEPAPLALGAVGLVALFLFHRIRAVRQA